MFSPAWIVFLFIRTILFTSHGLENLSNSHVHMHLTPLHPCTRPFVGAYNSTPRAITERISHRTEANNSHPQSNLQAYRITIYTRSQGTYEAYNTTYICADSFISTRITLTNTTHITCETALTRPLQRHIIEDHRAI